VTALVEEAAEQEEGSPALSSAGQPAESSPATPTPEPQGSSLMAPQRRRHWTCPLCSRPLSLRLRDVVLKKHRERQEEIAGQLFVIREQLAVADREIELLQAEYRRLSQELATWDERLHLQGRLQQQWEAEQERRRQIQLWQAEAAELREILDREAYAQEARQQLQQIQQALHQLGYDEREHALQRGELERWRWALGRSQELRKAQERRSRLCEQIASLQAQLETLQQAVSKDSVPPVGSDSPLAERLAQVEQALNHLGYDGSLHQQVKAELAQAQLWPVRLQALQVARQELPEVAARTQALSPRLQGSRQHFAQATQSWNGFQQQLAEHPEVLPAQLEGIRQTLREHRRRLDEVLSQIGARPTTATTGGSTAGGTGRAGTATATGPPPAAGVPRAGQCLRSQRHPRPDRRKCPARAGSPGQPDPGPPYPTPPAPAIGYPALRATLLLTGQAVLRSGTESL
jgi:Chromosome segregation ATPases